MLRYDDLSNDLGPLWSHQSCPDCIIATRGYDFREGHLLTKVLEDNLNDFDDGDVARLIQFRHERLGDEFPDENGGTTRHRLLGFSVELSDETASAQTVIEEFAAALPDTPPIFHAVKFEDPILQVELFQRATEIYALEMKLRRALSLIYLHAYQTGDSFDLLRDEAVQPVAKERPTAEQMRAAAENQFFHLTFGQYVGLNQRPDIKISAMLEVIRTAAQYESFRSEILRSPVAYEDDAVLLAGLKERMDAIERMRNCVAHNRHPPRSVTENYLNARPLLNQLLDDYMGRWQTQT
jgi:hypothetical protein